MTKKEKRHKYCSGCRDNFYNDNNPFGIKECLCFKNAKVVWKKRVHMNQRPPWDQKAIRVLDCRHENCYVFVGAEQIR